MICCCAMSPSSGEVAIASRNNSPRFGNQIGAFSGAAKYLSMTL